MKNLVIILFMAFGLTASGQYYEGIEFMSFDLEASVWEDEFKTNQVQKLYDGEWKIKRKTDDGSNFNYWYNEEGVLIYKVEVKCIHFIDTTYTMDLDTGEAREYISKGYRDMPNGSFEKLIEVHWIGNGNKKSEQVFGSYSMGIKTGTWSHVLPHKNYKVSVNVNSKGFAEGKYEEVYLSNGQLKWTGQYIVISIDHNRIDYDTLEPFVWTEVLSAPDGLWQRYEIDGSKMNTIEYLGNN